MAPVKDVLTSRCQLCSATSGTLPQCAGCHAVRYCGPEHQTSDWKAHKRFCTPIKRAAAKLAREEQRLREWPENDFMTPTPVFEVGEGRFWSIFETRDYMRARIDLQLKLSFVHTRESVESQLAHLRDMLRLCRSDNLGVRDIVPGIYLRLHRDQECYDFMKWYATEGNRGDYDWHDIELPFLNLVGEDVMEEPEVFTGSWPDAAHMIAVTLIKLRMLLDLKDVLAAEALGPRLHDDAIREIQVAIASRSNILTERRQLLNPEGLEQRIGTLERQLKALYKGVQRANSHFWKALVRWDPYIKEAELPDAMARGSRDEMIMLIKSSARSWAETEGALEWVRERVNAA